MYLLYFECRKNARFLTFLPTGKGANPIKFVFLLNEPQIGGRTAIFSLARPIPWRFIYPLDPWISGLLSHDILLNISLALFSQTRERPVVMPQ